MRWAFGPLFVWGSVSVAKTSPKVVEIIEPVVTAMGYELVGIEFTGAGRRQTLRIYIDSPVGITLDDCSRVSYQVSGALDVEDPIPTAYTLEISSPGLDRPLFNPQDYERFVGKRVQVRLADLVEGRRKVTGVLKGLRGNTVVVEEQGLERVLPLERIEKANLVPEV